MVSACSAVTPATRLRMHWQSAFSCMVAVPFVVIEKPYCNAYSAPKPWHRPCVVRRPGQGFAASPDPARPLSAVPAQVVALFSATLPERAEELARSVAQRPVRVTVGERNAAAGSVRQRLVFVGSEAGRLLALRDLLRGAHADARPPYLVFAGSKQRAAELQRCAHALCLFPRRTALVTLCTLGVRTRAGRLKTRKPVPAAPLFWCAM